MRTTNRLLVLITVLLALHLVKDITTPVMAKVAKDKIVVREIEKPVRVQIVGVDRRVGATWDALNCGGASEWSNE